MDKVGGNGDGNKEMSLIFEKKALEMEPKGHDLIRR